MGNNFAMNDQSLARSFSVRDDERDEFFHSSTYAGAQNEGRIGAGARGMTIEERQALAEKRKFVRGYESAGLATQMASMRERNISTLERGGSTIERGGTQQGISNENRGETSDRNADEAGLRAVDRIGARATDEVGVRAANGMGTKTSGGETDGAQGGYRYSDDLAKRRETNSYKDYAAMAKQDFRHNYGRATGGMNGTTGYGGNYGCGASRGQGFAPNFGESIERNYGRGYGGEPNYGGESNYGSGQKYGGEAARDYNSTGRGYDGYRGGQNYGSGQNYGAGKTGQSGLNSAISNTQRFANNFGAKFGPKKG